MSQENVEIVRRAFAEFGSSAPGVEEIIRAGLVAPNAELDFSAMYPDGPILRGHEAWRGYFEALPWGKSTKIVPERFIDVDDGRVLVFVHVTAEGQGSGIPVEMRTAYELTIREGACARWKVYADRAEALEAAGLSE